MKKLLCTFCCFEDIDLTVFTIKNNYELTYKKLYLFENLNKDDGVIISYNVSGVKQFIPNTILINRNADTNTLYTLNAMNAIIYSDLGYLDKSYKINWKKYKNRLLTTSDNELIEHGLEFVEVIY